MSVSSIPQCPRDCFEATAKAIGCGTLEDDLNCFCLDTSAQTSATDTLQTCLLSCNVDDILSKLPLFQWVVPSIYVKSPN